MREKGSVEGRHDFWEGGRSCGREAGSVEGGRLYWRGGKKAEGGARDLELLLRASDAYCEALPWDRPHGQ